MQFTTISRKKAWEKPMKVTETKDWETFRLTGADILSDTGYEAGDEIPISIYGFEDHVCITGERGNSRARVLAFTRKEFEEGFLGWFEADNDVELITSCLDRAMNWFRKKGKKRVVGPLNGSTWDSYRFNISGEKSLFMGEPARPSFYFRSWEAFGFLPTEKYISKILNTPRNKALDRAGLEKFTEPLGLQLEELTIRNYEKYIRRLHDLLIQGFLTSGNPWFLPISYEEFRLRYDPIISGLPENTLWILTDKAQNPVAFLLSYPSKLNDPEKNLNGTAMITKSMAIHPEYHGMGIGTALIRFSTALAAESGCPYQILALMHHQNPSTHFLKASDAIQTRQYHMLEYKL